MGAGNCKKTGCTCRCTFRATDNVSNCSGSGATEYHCFDHGKGCHAMCGV